MISFRSKHTERSTCGKTNLKPGGEGVGRWKFENGKNELKKPHLKPMRELSEAYLYTCEGRCQRKVKPPADNWWSSEVEIFQAFVSTELAKRSAHFLAQWTESKFENTAISCIRQQQPVASSLQLLNWLSHTESCCVNYMWNPQTPWSTTPPGLDTASDLVVMPPNDTILKWKHTLSMSLETLMNHHVQEEKQKEQRVRVTNCSGDSGQVRWHFNYGS